MQRFLPAVFVLPLAACSVPLPCTGPFCADPELNCVDTPSLCDDGEVCDADFGTCHPAPGTVDPLWSDSRFERRILIADQAGLRGTLDLVTESSHLSFDLPEHLEVSAIENVGGPPIEFEREDRFLAFGLRAPEGRRSFVRIHFLLDDEAFRIRSVAGVEHLRPHHFADWAPSLMGAPPATQQWLDVRSPVAEPLGSGELTLSTPGRRVFRGDAGQFAIADFERRAIESTSTSLSLWVAPRDLAPELQEAVDSSGQYFDAMVDLLGLPDAESVRIVVAPSHDVGGAALRNTAFIEPGRDGLLANQHLVAHELAHQWAGVDLEMPYWLEEGLAQLVAFRVVHPNDDTYAEVVRDLSQSCVSCDIIAPVRAQQSPEHEHVEVLYRKSAVLLYLLSVSLGPDVFWSSVRDALATGRELPFPQVTTEAFFDALPDTTEVRALRTDFVEQAGWPALDIDIFVDDAGRARATVTQTQPGPAVRLLGATAPELTIYPRDAADAPCRARLELDQRVTELNDLCDVPVSMGMSRDLLFDADVSMHRDPGA